MFTTNSSKIWDMRVDSLAALLHYSNVMPHSRVLVLDDTRGLLSGAAAERMGGQGSLWSVALHAGKSSSTEVRWRVLPLVIVVLVVVVMFVVVTAV